MAPLFDLNLPKPVYDTIREHKLAVWLDLGDGRNAAVSDTYEGVLGRPMGDEAWKIGVQNPEYSQSYDEYRERADHSEKWEHPLIWLRPDTGEIDHHLSRASWVEIADQWYILGEVLPNTEPIPEPPLPPVVPWWAIAAQQLATFLAGFAMGFALDRWLL